MVEVLAVARPGRRRRHGRRLQGGSGAYVPGFSARGAMRGGSVRKWFGHDSSWFLSIDSLIAMHLHPTAGEKNGAVTLKLRLLPIRFTEFFG